MTQREHRCRSQPAASSRMGGLPAVAHATSVGSGSLRTTLLRLQSEPMPQPSTTVQICGDCCDAGIDVGLLMRAGIGCLVNCDA